MDKEELEWATNRCIGEKMYFMSQYGITDTMFVTDIRIHNSLNPINLNYCASDEYIAISYVDFKLNNKGDTIDGMFSIEKPYGGGTTNVNCHLDRRYALDVPLKTSSLQFGKTIISDVILFDENNSSLDDLNDQENPVVSFIWSKKYGLIQYCFKDGTKFSRTALFR